MTTSATFNGDVLRADNPDDISEYKMTLKMGERIAITFEPWGKFRTRKQQGLLHELIGRYARQNNESAPHVKMRWKVELGYYVPADPVLSGTIDAPEWTSRVIDLHDLYPELHGQRTFAFVRSESTYTTRMEAEFIEHAIAACSATQTHIEDILKTLAMLKKGADND